MTHRSDQERRQRYRHAALALHDHLHGVLDAQGGYPDVVTWGYAMSVLLSAEVGDGQLTELGAKAAHHLALQAHADPNYSWEFVVLSIQKAKRRLKAASPLPCDVHRAKGTRMFNWFLLRQVNRGWFDTSPSWTLFKLRLARKLYVSGEGLVQDEFRTRSLQYHAFCLYLLCELVVQHPKAAFLQEWLVQGLQVSFEHMLTDGSAMWIGRGQEQIFGYGSLLYAAEFVHAHLQPQSTELLKRLQDRVLHFQRGDGSFPLVFRHREPEQASARQAELPPGWYGYNTLYDYQPFLAHAMWQASVQGEGGPWR